MAGMEPLGKMLLIAGLLLAAGGAILWFGAGRMRGGLLPGDLSFERGSFKFYFPLATCIVLSVILTLLFRLLRK